MKTMLDRCMERNMACTKEDADALGNRFLERLTLANELFDGRPFTLSLKERIHRPVAGIYDGVMIALDGLWQSRGKLIEHKEKIQEAYVALIKEQSKVGALTGAANTAADIRGRIGKFRSLFTQFI
jgi:hypothetical protein